MKQPKFEGKCANLKGHIYNCSDSRQLDQFMKTTKEIAKYVGRTYKYGGDIRMAVETLEPVEFNKTRRSASSCNQNAGANLGKAS